VEAAVTIELRGTGYFGKVPTAGDFQRQLTTDGPDPKTLDWFHDGWARHALAGRRPDLSAPSYFCWQRPGSDTALIGVMIGSRDRAGRRFPLLVFGAASGVERTADLLSSSRDFLQRAESVAATGRAGVDLTALRGHVDALRTGLDGEGRARQSEWETATTAAAWVDGSPRDAAERLRCLRFALSSGGRPNFVLRGRWHGDLRHFAAGVAMLQQLAQSPPAMLFWNPVDGAIAWRAAWEYAAPGLFEALVWHDVQAATAFDTDPGAVAVPATFVGPPPPAAETSLSRLLEAR
jgi:type VI secretion system ImpM family protein